MEKREQKKCQNCKASFTIEPQDFKFYAKMQVPAPTFCPECRLIRRLSFRNERNLYPGTCDMCNKSMISMYSGAKPYKVYCQPCWWSDKWDGLEYGREYDFKKPFFEQFDKLMHDVPWASLQTTYTTLVNSEYVNMAGDVKNCYLISHADHNEDCYYGSGIKYSRDCVDITMMQHAEFCYDSLNIMQGYQNFYSADCENCNDVYFSKNLVGCSNCFGCVNLRHKSYYIFNKLYSKENYEKKIEEIKLGSYKEIQELKKKVHEFWKQFPSKYYHGSKNQNVSGDYIYNCKNVEHCYEMMGAEDCRYSQNLSTKPSKDCYDYSEWGEGANFIYETGQSGIGINNVKFGFVIYSSRDIEYSMASSNCQNVLGCIALRHKKYCIFNKQYSKSDYEALREKIIKQMNTMPYNDKQGKVYGYGEYFPIQLSQFTYNETAVEFFPLSRETAIEKGYGWKEKDKREYKPSSYEIPDDIKDTKDDITSAVLACSSCGKNYRVIKQELAFYRKFNIPVPRKCPDCRHFERVVFRSPMRLTLRDCNKCGKKLKSNITSEISPIIYCDACYLSEIV